MVARCLVKNCSQPSPELTWRVRLLVNDHTCGNQPLTRMPAPRLLRVELESKRGDGAVKIRNHARGYYSSNDYYGISSTGNCVLYKYMCYNIITKAR